MKMKEQQQETVQLQRLPKMHNKVVYFFTKVKILNLFYDSKIVYNYKFLVLLCHKINLYIVRYGWGNRFLVVSGSK